jgi:predicted porin
VAKLYGQYTHLHTKADATSGSTLWSLGASVPIGAGRLLAQFGHANASAGGVDRTQRTLSVGYDYLLSKRTDVYAVYMHDRLTGVSAGNTLAGGVRLRF